MLQHMKNFPFFQGWIKFHCVYIYRTFFIHSFINDYLSCFYNLAVENIYNEHGYAYTSFTSCFQFCWVYNQKKIKGITRSYGNFIFNFLRSLHTIFHSDWIILHCLQQYKGDWFFFFLIANSGHPNVFEVICHCGFDLHFSNDQYCYY